MKTEKKKTLRGSALFTVVAVMAILILFLTGTLMLATASNRRAHKSYSVSQASYTARSAIRSFKAALEDPTNGPGIQAALYSLDPNDPTDILEPQILMGDNSMGRIGYWDNSGNWKDNCIKLEAVPGRVDWVYNETSDEWIPYNVILVTSTCRLGREEETVRAFISRNTETVEGEEPVSDSEVKGLQEAGGNNFQNGGDIYGGLGVALADDPSDGVGEYTLHNEWGTHTTLNFINASIKSGTSTFKIHVEKSNATPVSGNVIMGSVTPANDSFVILENSYEMAKNYRQKDIPYLYIDQLLYEREPTSNPFIKPADGMTSTKFQPFNIYLGTLYYPCQFEARADLYLMDEPVINGAGKREVYPADGAYFKSRDEVWWPEHIITETPWPSEYTSEGVQAVPKGENFFGCDINGVASDKSRNQVQLYKWASSTFSRKDSYDSFGGNIYCKGNFHFGAGIINGNVRVEGDFYLQDVVADGSRPRIEGDLVVVGTIHDNAHYSIDDVVQGVIYNDGLASGGAGVTVSLKSGYEKVENALFPGYTEIETAELENRELKEENGEIIITDDGIQCVIDGNTYSTTPYILTVPITDTTYGDSNPAVITTDPKTRYEVDKDGKFVFTGEGDERAPVQTTKEKLYFDDEGIPCSESDAKGTYYIQSGIPDVMVPFSEANTVSTGSSKAVPYSEFQRIYSSNAYPANMTREKIYGEYQDGKFVTHSDTKLVTTLDEARKALSWNKTDGSFDKTVYPFTEPTVDPDHIISGNQTGTLEITRPADGFEWYVLDNVSFNNGGGIDIVDAPGAVQTGNKKYGGGVVRFFIKGDLTFKTTCRIKLKTMPPIINYTDDFGIEYYGMAEEQADGSIVGKSHIQSENYTLIVGSIKAPYMTMSMIQGEGPDTFTYIPESGVSVTYKPAIIGNALVDKLTEARNSFKLAYTKSGTGSSHSSSETDSTETTADGDWVFTYMAS